MQERTSADFLLAVDEQLALIETTIAREWMDHILTKAMVNYCKGLRLGIMESWADGVYEHENQESTSLANSKALGVLTGVSHLEEFFKVLQTHVKEEIEHDEDSDSGIQDSY